jgi:spore germination protein KB
MYLLKELRGNSMEKIKKVSSYQIILLIIIYRMIIAFTYGPAINTPPGNQDVWIACLFYF